MSTKNQNGHGLLSSVVVGVACGGLGYYYGYCCKTGQQNNDILEMVPELPLNLLREKCSEWYQRMKQKLREIVESKEQIPLWLIIMSACPHWDNSKSHAPLTWFWYPLALYYTWQHTPALTDTATTRGGLEHDVNNNDTNVSGSSSSTNIAATASPGRYLEMLVHNVSHTDMVLSVDVPKNEAATGDDGNMNPQKSDNDYCLCRPRFSAFDLYSKKILEALQSSKSDIVSFPNFERSQQTLRYPIVTPSPSRRSMIPTGFALSEAAAIEQISNVRFRGRDLPRVEDYQKQYPDSQLGINNVFFPLLANLLPKWYDQIETKQYKSEIKKVVILVTGVGTPRNWTHSVSGNSTKACAELMEQFIHELYTDVTVVRIHSETNIFRYDENISFAKRELLPCIEAYRDHHARNESYPDEVNGRVSSSRSRKPFFPDWKQSFAVTLSFADGSHARTHAIQASLKGYRPTYFHIWQLKTFWHDTKICEDDIEVHSFEDMEGVPAMDTSSLSSQEAEKSSNNSDLKRVVQEMVAFRQEFCRTVSSDIFKFWLRKTKKPVLAVLLVDDAHGTTRLYRGTNMEVSMPTGSLCAERNVIGTALASNPCLKRQDLRMIAVLAVPPAMFDAAGTNVPSVASTSLHNKDPAPAIMKRNLSVGSLCSVIEDVNQDEEGQGRDQEDWVLQQPPYYSDDSNSNNKSQSTTTSTTSADKGDTTTATTSLQLADQPSTTAATQNVITVSKSPRFSPAISGSVPPAFNMPMPPPLSLASSTPNKTPPGTPRRVISLYANPDQKNQQKRKVVVNSSEDMNPLKPCGACNEWLKKISESNPYFKVVTFTDADCTGVYVSPIQE